ncbi:GNAT family N-acetyltransferase [Flavobacterium litorale]|uniref:GNAT family N-acetyltransferase n=1 Tax=Flavobacterium litorale TaxID=2856519 RepID=A0ABX8VD42_9FLAO|nr:GNAT family N-acetyltransferase [Flavobacterium litorale]QYJ68589.1 GNAT family N-acetyltransferase [Flavobacterium litorale]
MQRIKKIQSAATYAVRQPVLRPGLPVSSCIFEGDDLSTTVHFGVFEADGLAGIISVFKSRNELFTNEVQFQIRGMAILPEHQKKGLGEKLLQTAESYIIQNSGKLVWCNAREVAVGFYKKAGYSIIGNAFTIKGVGVHYVMYKTL